MNAINRVACVRVAFSIFVALAATSAQADNQVSVQFVGTVTGVTDNLNAFGGVVGVGDPFTAKIVYELSNPGGPVLINQNNQQQFYQYGAPTWQEPIGMFVTIEGFTFDTVFAQVEENLFTIELIDANNSPFIDIFNASSARFAMNVSNAGSYNDLGMGIQLQGSHTTLSNTNQPADIDLNDWTAGTNTLSLFGNSQGFQGFSISGRITAVVPEPTSSAIALLCLVGMAAGARQRRGARWKSLGTRGRCCKLSRGWCW